MNAFRVITPNLQIRPSPSTTKNATGSLRLGEIVTVKANVPAPVDAHGYRWWRHERGWSAEKPLDGSAIYMKAVSDPDVLLPVPWVSQLGFYAPGKNDCGQACVLMLLKYAGLAGRTTTVNTLTNIRAGLTNAWHLEGLAGLWGLATEVEHIPNNATGIDIIKGYLDAKRPVIMLVNYKDLGFIPHLVSGTNQGLHWLIATGHDKDGLYGNDPLWADGQPNGQGGVGGEALYIPNQQLLKAIRFNLSPVVVLVGDMM